MEAGATRLRLLAGLALLEHYIRLQLAVRPEHRSENTPGVVPTCVAQEKAVAIRPRCLSPFRR